MTVMTFHSQYTMTMTVTMVMQTRLVTTTTKEACKEEQQLQRY